MWQKRRRRKQQRLVLTRFGSRRATTPRKHINSWIRSVYLIVVWYYKFCLIVTLFLLFHGWGISGKCSCVLLFTHIQETLRQLFSSVLLCASTAVATSIIPSSGLTYPPTEEATLRVRVWYRFMHTPVCAGRSGRYGWVVRAGIWHCKLFRPVLEALSIKCQNVLEPPELIWY